MVVIDALCRLYGHVGHRLEVRGMPLYGAVSEREFCAGVLPVLSLTHLACAFRHGECRRAEERVGHEEMLGCVDGLDAQGEVVYLAVGPAHGRL